MWSNGGHEYRKLMEFLKGFVRSNFHLDIQYRVKLPTVRIKGYSAGNTIAKRPGSFEKSHRNADN